MLRRPLSNVAVRSVICVTVIAVTMPIVTRLAVAQGGINMSWDDCGPFGRAQRNFACDTHTGSATLVLSAIPPAPMSHIVGMQAVIEIFTGETPLSAWWRLDPGGCRSGSLSAGFDFTQGPQSCVDLWHGAASGGFAYTADAAAGDGVVTLSCGVPTEVSTNGVDELYLARLTIDYARSAGADSCSGCSRPACIVLLCVQLLQPAGMPSYTLPQPLIRSFVAFQPFRIGDSYCPPLPGSVSTPCPGSVPARQPTWGQIKSLYR